MNKLTLKWGTLKAWQFDHPKAQELFDRYSKIGSSMSAAMQKDTPEQKEIICKLIDLVDDQVYLDWDGKYVSKQDAKKYVMEYGND